MVNSDGAYDEQVGDAAAARGRRDGSTLVERTRRDPLRAARIDALGAALAAEHPAIESRAFDGYDNAP
jgi:hypothetical protein